MSKGNLFVGGQGVFEQTRDHLSDAVADATEQHQQLAVLFVHWSDVQITMTSISEPESRRMTAVGKSVSRQKVCPEGTGVNDFGSTVVGGALSSFPLNAVSACHNSLLFGFRSRCGEESPSWNGRIGDGWIEPVGGIAGTAITPAREGRRMTVAIRRGAETSLSFVRTPSSLSLELSVQ
jgi:hypothetical protein